MRKIALFIVCAVACTAASAATPPTADKLSPLRFLVGSCWQGTFPDGENVDTHCFAAVYGNAFIRDTHLVRGTIPDYRGETIYQWDESTGGITYRYWNSLGGVSDGVVRSEESKLLFPGERHVKDDGTVIEIQSVIQPMGADKYLSMSEQKTADGWEQVRRIEFSRLSDASEMGPAARQQADKLAALSRLIGDWSDPASIADARKSGSPVPIQQSLAWGARHMLLRVYENLSQSFAEKSIDPVMEGILLWDHVDEVFRFTASTRYGWTFHGSYRVLDDERIERVYQVHYQKDEAYIPERDMGGQVRRFREVYRFDSDDRLQITLEIWKNEQWTPFGPGEYTAVRISG